MLNVLYIIINISCPMKRIINRGMSCNLLRVRERIILTMGWEKTTNDAIKFSYHFHYLMLNQIFLGFSTKIFHILHKLDENNHLNSKC